MKYYDKLIFELSKPGRTGYSLPEIPGQAQPSFRPKSRNLVHFIFPRAESVNRKPSNSCAKRASAAS